MPIHSQPLREHDNTTASDTIHDLNSIHIEDENDIIDDDEESGDAVKQLFAFAGLQKAVSKYTGQSEFMVDTAISDDLEAEQQSMGPEPDDGAASGDEVPMDIDSNDINPNANLSSMLAGALTGVTEGTESHYKSLMKQCEKFLWKCTLIKDDEDFFCDTPRVDALELICVWILDAFNLDGTARPEIERRSSYSHAQKMRASATYGFGQLHRLGNLPWHKSEVLEKMLDNLLVSQQVSLYMVHAGEEPTSARAVTEGLIEEMYNFSCQPEYFDIKPFIPQSHKEHSKK
ncbi:hypothetical protein WG66_006492 [Moniliophthora roreri]|nr:hypothetical protein WG66_006492 [Moniliophthora roreri]